MRYKVITFDNTIDYINWVTKVDYVDIMSTVVFNNQIVVTYKKEVPHA